MKRLEKICASSREDGEKAEAVAAGRLGRRPVAAHLAASWGGARGERGRQAMPWTDDLTLFQRPGAMGAVVPAILQDGAETHRGATPSEDGGSSHPRCRGLGGPPSSGQHSKARASAALAPGPGPCGAVEGRRRGPALEKWAGRADAYCFLKKGRASQGTSSPSGISVNFAHVKPCCRQTRPARVMAALLGRGRASTHTRLRWRRRPGYFQHFRPAGSPCRSKPLSGYRQASSDLVSSRLDIQRAIRRGTLKRTPRDRGGRSALR